MKADDQIKAPAHLRPETQQWWETIARTHGIEEGRLHLLTAAGEAWDRHCEARETLAEVGMTYIDRFGQPHARPEVAIERDSRAAFVKIVKEMGLDETERAIGRPPGTSRPIRREYSGKSEAMKKAFGLR